MNRNAGIRIDINSTVKNGKLKDTGRIDNYIPHIEDISDDFDTLYIMSHQGRPGEDSFISLSQHAKYIDQQTTLSVDFCPSTNLNKIGDRLNSCKSDIIVVENTRFFESEMRNYSNAVEAAKSDFVDALSKCFDVFINDAFSVSHRKHASTIGFLPLMESRMGPLFRSEIEFLNSSFWSGEDRVCVIGGSKISDKCKYLCQMIKNDRADRILVTGKVSCVILNRLGYDINENYISEISQDIMSQLDYIVENNKELLDFPIDVAVDNNGRKNLRVEDIKTNNSILDIGYRTVDNYRDIIRNSSSVIVAGPAGYYERENFNLGTGKILEIVSRQDSSMLAGGDTLSASNILDISGFSHVSLGGGAALEFLLKEETPVFRYLLNYE